MAPDTHTALLFVYGTLRRGSRHAWADTLADAATFVGQARFRGRLYEVADYPGAVASEDSRERVAGDVYRLREPEAMLRRLDAYEGYSANADTGEYVRRVVSIDLERGGAADAWIYLYNRSTDGLTRIRSGDFCGSPSGCP